MKRSEGELRRQQAHVHGRVTASDRAIVSSTPPEPTEVSMFTRRGFMSCLVLNHHSPAARAEAGDTGTRREFRSAHPCVFRSFRQVRHPIRPSNGNPDRMHELLHIVQHFWRLPCLALRAEGILARSDHWCGRHFCACCSHGRGSESRAPDAGGDSRDRSRYRLSRLGTRRFSWWAIGFRRV